ncbi:response regulator [Anaeromusa sp.]|jgi:two-component system chemotaxis response regulator CheY|uniref:response regulator n=1 Tax=Anaeromusa sp. TaxID=1872520 RepID=UPI0026047078|nr:response regulator [Anaeromusa sp.]MDD3156823.1 response regulator [Anaeromusa sp.]NCB76267.1 response regulator [Negativicutes bacterium]
MARVMIVDDALMMRKTLRRMLEKIDCEIVEEAASGEQALVKYAQCCPDLVTMDLTMPGMGGLEAIRQLKAQEPAANILVISALGQKHAVFEALQLGAKNYIVKPINEENLQSVVRLLLSETTKEAAHG